MVKYWVLALLLLGLLACCGRLYAQRFQVITYRVIGDTAQVIYDLPSPSASYEQNEAINYLQQLVPLLQRQGFLAASLDTFWREGFVFHAGYYVGPHFQKAVLKTDSLPYVLIANRVVDEKQWQPQVWDAKKVAQQSKKILQYFENNGYPFAQVFFKNITIDSTGNFHGWWYVEKGAERLLDSIIIKNEDVVKRNFLLRYLDLKQGEPYNEKKLSTLSTRLLELPYLQEAAPWTVTFQPNFTELNLDLKDKKANTINAIVGLQPNTQVTGKFLLTVDAQFAFKNMLGYGESFAFSYQNLQYRSPKLNVEAAVPYVLQTNIGIDAGFELFQNNLQFRRTKFNGGLRYQLTATDFLRVYYQQQTNRVQQFDTMAVVQNFQLPANADYKNKGVGMEVLVNKTDYRLNPRKGWLASVRAAGTKRQIIENDAVLGFSNSGKDYQQLYDSANAYPFQLHAVSVLEGYVPVGNSFTFKTAYNGGIIGGRQLFRNELFQIGGHLLLRGFDEQSLFVNQYHIITLEMRYFLATNSFVQLFSDNGYLVSKYSGYNGKGWYNGFGVGAAFENKTGLFSISYALGASPGHPVQLRASKIHFGYLAFF